MRKPAACKAIKMGLIVSVLGLYKLGFLPGIEPSMAKRKPLSSVDSMFQEMKYLRGKSANGTDLDDIAKKYLKIDTSKEDVLTFFKQSKNHLKATEYTSPNAKDNEMNFILEMNNWVCNSSYTVHLTLRANLVKDIHARYDATCL